MHRKPLSSLKLDNRGFTAEEKQQTDEFIQEYLKNPLIYPDFQDLVFSKGTLGAVVGKEGALRRSAELYLFERDDIYLGIGASWDQQKWQGTALKCRKAYGDCYAWFSHPRIQEIINDVTDCAKVAAATATLTAIWVSPSAAQPVFETAFYGCLQAKAIGWANQVGVGLYTETSYGRWHNCL